MLKEIHLADGVRTPFGSFCGASADLSTVELGKAAVERSGVKPEDVKELLVGNILSGALRPNAARQTRGTIANVRIKNLMVPGVEGGYTLYFGEREVPAPDKEIKSKNGKPTSPGPGGHGRRD